MEMETDRDLYGDKKEELLAQKQGNGYILSNSKGKVGEITYSLVDVDTWVVEHIFVAPEYRGGQLGRQLLDFVVEDARDKGRKIVPSCSYALAEFKRNERAYADVWEKSNTTFADPYSSSGMTANGKTP
jgi:predicted GNAT family acetyltransferase